MIVLAVGEVSFFLPALALVTLFVVINVVARFRYAIEGEYFVARWYVLWFVPLQKSRVKLTRITAIDRFSWKKDVFRFHRQFGRPFSRQGAMIKINGMRLPMYVSPDDFEEFRRDVLEARERALSGAPYRS